MFFSMIDKVGKKIQKHSTLLHFDFERRVYNEESGNQQLAVVANEGENAINVETQNYAGEQTPSTPSALRNSQNKCHRIHYC